MAIFFVLIFQLVVVSIIIFIFASGLWSMWSGAPFVPMARRHIHGLLKFGGVGAGDIVYDLGCGDGRILRAAVRQFGAKQAIGYDIAPWPYTKARLLNWWAGLGDLVSVHRQSFATADLGSATFIYLYLFPNLVNRAASQIEQQTKPGTRVLSASFPIDLARHPGLRLQGEGKVGSITAYLYVRV